MAIPNNQAVIGRGYPWWKAAILRHGARQRPAKSPPGRSRKGRGAYVLRVAWRAVIDVTETDGALQHSCPYAVFRQQRSAVQDRRVAGFAGAVLVADLVARPGRGAALATLALAAGRTAGAAFLTAALRAAAGLRGVAGLAPVARLPRG